jgi:hypothetical protein
MCGGTATTKATVMWGFLLKARQQMVGPADRHPSENTAREEKEFYTMTLTNIYESKTSMKIKLFI